MLKPMNRPVPARPSINVQGFPQVGWCVPLGLVGTIGWYIIGGTVLNTPLYHEVYQEQ